MSSKIHLPTGLFALVDDEDFEALSVFNWHFGGRYVVRTPDLCDGNQVQVSMHRSIMGLAHDDKNSVDHINGNGLDNRRANLRLCSLSQNQANRGIGKNNTSGAKGVSWSRSANKWSASIKNDGKTINLGTFDILDEAAHAYNKAAISMFGDFARINPVGIEYPRNIGIDHAGTEFIQQTSLENSRYFGSRLSSNNASGFKGVSFHAKQKKFNARIALNGKMIHLGSFMDPQEAAHAYNRAAIFHHGDLAVLNPIGEDKS